MTRLVWFRTDLRIDDNTALTAACRDNERVIAVWIISPAQWRGHHDAPVKVDFWRRNLICLSRQLEALGIPLLLRNADRWSAIPEVLADLCRVQQVTDLYVNVEYGANEHQRDAAVQKGLEVQGVRWHSYTDRVIFEPGSLLTRDGNFLQVFSQFRRLCHQRLVNRLPTLQPTPTRFFPDTLLADPIPDGFPGFPAMGKTIQDYWPAGSEAAYQRLTNFIENKIEHYDKQRDLPALEATSVLSPYLAAGVLSPRQCLHAALSANQGEITEGNKGIVAWIDELLWRDFYQHILVGFPRVSKNQAFRTRTEHLPWRQAPNELTAWQQGRTGIPLVDAAMRQLQKCGWMHNRLRMVTAMFLSKNLLIDWRSGERWFMQHLVDGDLAANNGGWQWSASTGTDAVPYFRIFNPVRQSRRFDPDGHFIRHWVPELANLSAKDIHEPWTADLFGSRNYPPPIVDLKASRQRALSAFKNLEQDL